MRHRSHRSTLPSAQSTARASNEFPALHEDLQQETACMRPFSGIPHASPAGYLLSMFPNWRTPLESHKADSGSSFDADLRLVDDLLHLEDRDHWKHSNEDKEEHDEEANRSAEGRPIPDRRVIHAPARRQEIAAQADHNNDEALEPHAHIHDERDEKDRKHIVTYASRPQSLGYDKIAKDQGPVQPVVGAGQAVDHPVSFVWISG